MCMENKGKKVDQESGNFVPFGNEMVCKPAPSLMPLYVLVPLPSGSRPSHPKKKVKILIMCLYCECMNNGYECKDIDICTLPDLVCA